MIPTEMWLHMLWTYETWCYDLGCRAIDELMVELNAYWEKL